jgi:mRNA interferase RelE/StbE
MAWKFEFEPPAAKELKRIDAQTRVRILKFLHERIAPLDNPRDIGEALQGRRLGAYWKYRVGDHRIIASIEDEIVTIVVVQIGNRREVYRR